MDQNSPKKDFQVTATGLDEKRRKLGGDETGSKELDGLYDGRKVTQMIEVFIG